MNFSYSKHSSSELNKLFLSRPYQGQSPRKAKFIFMGLDANFAQDIETTDCFPFIKEYLMDGVQFWKKYKVHHPFLLPQYPDGDGVTYHKRFSKLNLAPDYADEISFIELIDVPTVGKTERKQFYKLLNPKYIREIEELLLSTDKKTLFISRSVLTYLERIKKIYNLFTWLPKAPNLKLNNLSLIFENNALRIYGVTHFSAAISDVHINQIQRVISG